ncbi:MAG: hypothetical protein A3C30_01845 [Candidatus Levybacteria bacterium RIFCSPHIGHO2_02_FULL_40_18]|nr:MAG: hypothetical protein A2869_04225 [Candidatus Levybacteria bacterium RIFCSPHIGHO2_01_FULL_40_58]OGH26733.1 MAG: hypothetical protein A3C30_01845 [Candidatus Levybacteria bacterium RIFCSPHIGHO2_02_FULL_40_18]OGH31668.1 MAG: hypothetical protein A3E43_01565 [Candidatus Levybacteria bacterium RIFCSPHIGHO2_12_FULL_40_31]OGH40568.1 MAG: hypothetical protein A2894_00115 [Candidatus Levybacteria bacterium RIFCSPLOWO2_01_FULL_40_64]OGH48744.1 MAG: hypothetical protein A3I54_03740 [Candidatus Lev
MTYIRRKRLKAADLAFGQGKKSYLAKSPQEADEESISGRIADLESDDDVLEAAHKMGIGLSEDYEHPRELDIAKDVEKAEKYKRTH